MVEDGHPALSQRPAPGGRTGALATLPIGARIGKYVIRAVLGQGGFGITYLARDTRLDRDVAVKEYLPTAFAVRDPDSVVLPRSTHMAEDFRWGRERFLAEAKTLARFEKAPGIVNVYDFLEAHGTAYMVMGLVTGETLEARLRRDGPLPQGAIEPLLHPLLDGLEQVHGAGFLHRDIKPANILIDEKGQPTLIDFGASRAALQGRTQTLTAVYTPGYAAVEQFTSARQGPWTDIYALGATLYHCISGAAPPGASDRMIEDRLVPAAEAGKGRYGPVFLDWIDGSLKLRPEERPQSIDAWRRLQSQTASSLPTQRVGAAHRIDNSLAGTLARQRARRRWPLALAAAVAVLCLVGGGYLWWRSAQEAEAWARASAARTEAAYRGYLETHPSGRHAAEARELIAAKEREPRPRDCAQCPEMVRIPSGTFLMGSPPGEDGRFPDEGPQHWVTIGYAFSLGKYEVTRGEFVTFVAATGHQAAGDWRNPGFQQTDRDPVVNVTWNDAKAYVTWLSRTTGKRYRLPSEAEWEYAARAGTATARHWDEPHQDACRHANVEDTSHGCRDGHADTAPVGTFPPNSFGLHDMIGNVWEWTEDCWNDSYTGAPGDGSSWQQGDCNRRMKRGGSWTDYPRTARAAVRSVDAAGVLKNYIGFRVARAD